MVSISIGDVTRIYYDSLYFYLLITDGEDHEGGALEAAKEARKKGINVFILGILTICQRLYRYLCSATF